MRYNNEIFKDWLLSELKPEKRSGAQYPPVLGDSWASYWDNLDPIDESDFEGDEY